MISIIVAASDNNIIGHLNQLPWYLPRDLKNFAKNTRGHTTLMGRKTFDSIIKRLGHPLPERKNVIITRQKDFSAPPECVVVGSWEEAMEKTQGEEVFVSGGAEIYKMALHHADRLILTRVHKVSSGEITLPISDFADWNLVYEEFWPRDDKNECDATYQIYDRKK